MAGQATLAFPLYHGSMNTLAIGDLITPNTRIHAYATPKYESALRFADSPETVYRVEPLDPSEVIVRQMKYFSPSTLEHISKIGFRVIGKVE